MKTQIDLAIIKEQLMTNTKEHAEIKSEIGEVKVSVKEINSKLDTAIKDKADKEDVKDLRDKGWALVMAIIVAFLGLIVTTLKVFYGRF